MSRYLYSRGNRSYCSATVDVIESAERFGRRLKDMSQTSFRVWFALQSFVRNKNYVSVRLATLAEFCEVSLSTVHRAMRYFEEHDLIVRQSLPHQDSVWIINPEISWNSVHDEHPGGLAVYRKLRKENRERADQKKQAAMNNIEIISHSTEGNEECELQKAG